MCVYETIVSVRGHKPLLVDGPVFLQLLGLHSQPFSLGRVVRVETEEKWPNLLSQRRSYPLEEYDLLVHRWGVLKNEYCDSVTKKKTGKVLAQQHIIDMREQEGGGVGSSRDKSSWGGGGGGRGRG